MTCKPEVNLDEWDRLITYYEAQNPPIDNIVIPVPQARALIRHARFGKMVVEADSFSIKRLHVAAGRRLGKTGIAAAHMGIDINPQEPPTEFPWKAVIVFCAIAVGMVLAFVAGANEALR